MSLHRSHVFHGPPKDPSIRAFVSVELPEPVRLLLQEEGYLLRKAGGRASWVRPEHMHLSPVNGGGATASFKMNLNVVEPLGNDMDIYLSTNLHPHVVGRVEAQQGLEPNTQVTVYVDLRKVHFFEPGATGMNLSLVNEPSHAIA